MVGAGITAAWVPSGLRSRGGDTWQSWDDLTCKAVGGLPAGEKNNRSGARAYAADGLEAVGAMEDKRKRAARQRAWKMKKGLTVLRVTLAERRLVEEVRRLRMDAEMVAEHLRRQVEGQIWR